MIDPQLFAQPVAIDRNVHLRARLKEAPTRFDRTAGMNALFVTMVEFVDVSREYPIVFVDAGQGPDGKREVAPMAVLGLAKGENLMLRADGNWDAKYVPALLRGYPLGLARADGDRLVLVVDARADALSFDDAAPGEPLFDAQGNPTAQLEARRAFLEQLEDEAHRTRLFGRTLLELELLQTKRFDATLPDGSSLSVDGFLALDEARFEALPDDAILKLQRSGMLSMIYAHHFSMGQFRNLLERRLAATPPAAS